MNNEEPLKQIESQLAEAIESAQMFLREMTKALAERDAAVARAEKAEREDDEQYEHDINRLEAKLVYARARAEKAERERDEARALVRKLNAAEIYPSDCDDIVDKWGDI